MTSERKQLLDNIVAVQNMTKLIENADKNFNPLKLSDISNTLSLIKRQMIKILDIPKFVQESVI